MIKRILLAGSITLAAVGLGSATSAHAAQYPPGCATVVTGAATVNPATQMTITASGYTPQVPQLAPQSGQPVKP